MIFQILKPNRMIFITKNSNQKQSMFLFRILQFFFPMESVQLRNIQNIQNSLLLLKSKLEKLSKLDTQHEETLSKLIISTVPVVDRKLRETQMQEGLQQKRSLHVDRTQQIRSKNQESRLLNEKEVARSKELVSMMKQHNSLHLKQSKKLNEEKIRKIRELDLSEKKSRTKLVKQKENESQARIQQFHNQKQTQLRQRREEESKENEQRIHGLVQRMKDLERQEAEMLRKVKFSEESIGKFRSVIRKVDRMRCQDFIKFKEQISPTNKLKNSKSITEAILMFAAKNNVE